MTLSLRKKKICALAVLTLTIDKNLDENIGRRFWMRKILKERKRYGLYHILTNELCLFRKEYFFHFVLTTHPKTLNICFYWLDLICKEQQQEWENQFLLREWFWRWDFLLQMTHYDHSIFYSELAKQQFALF